MLKQLQPLCCGAKGSRTPDLYNAIVALYQLSYGPRYVVCYVGRKPHSLAESGESRTASTKAAKAARPRRKRRQYSNPRRKNPMHEQGDCLFRPLGIFIASARARPLVHHHCPPLYHAVYEGPDGLDGD